MSPEISSEQRQEAFKRLLTSNVKVAQVVALDYFCDIEALTRFGIENPYIVFSSMLLGVTRRQLRQATIEHQSKVSQYMVVLRALRFLGDIEDITLIESFITVKQDKFLLHETLLALDCFIADGEAIPKHLVKKLVQIILCEDVERYIRVTALGVFRSVQPLPEEVESFCLQIVGEGAPQDSLLPLHAAWVLGATNIARHRNLLEHLLATWPEKSAAQLRGYLQDVLGK